MDILYSLFVVIVLFVNCLMAIVNFGVLGIIKNN